MKQRSTAPRKSRGACIREVPGEIFLLLLECDLSASRDEGVIENCVSDGLFLIESGERMLTTSMPYSPEIKTIGQGVPSTK
jgi:hypothetical protein